MISDMWLALKNSDVWKNWPIPIVMGLMNKSGLLDNSPLLNYLEGVLATFDGYKRRTVLHTTNVETGEITFFS